VLRGDGRHRDDVALQPWNRRREQARRRPGPGNTRLDHVGGRLPGPGQPFGCWNSGGRITESILGEHGGSVPNGYVRVGTACHLRRAIGRLLAALDGEG